MARHTHNSPEAEGIDLLYGEVAKLIWTISEEILKELPDLPHAGVSRYLIELLCESDAFDRLDTAMANIEAAFESQGIRPVRWRPKDQ